VKLVSGAVVLCLWAATLAAAPEKSPPAATNEDCLTCHEDPAAKRANGTSVFVEKGKFSASVHGEAGLGCVDCHTDLAKTKDFPHPEKLAPAQCSGCHDDAVSAYSAGVHAQARQKSTGSQAATCVSCHGDPHSIVPRTNPASPISQEELFGPAVAVSTAADWHEAIQQANGTAYGLGAGIFTSDVAGAVRAIREIDAGSIHINWTPLWRADLMPYGGLKGSGIGKEGPRSAVAEMTDVKTIVLHGRPW